MSEVRRRLPVEAPPRSGEWARWLGLAVVIIFILACIVGIRIEQIDEQKKRDEVNRAASQLVYLSQLGFLRMMRTCAYVQALDGRTPTQMEQACSIPLNTINLKTFKGQPVR